MKKEKIKINKISYIKPVDGAILIAVFIMFIFLIAGVSIGTSQYKENQTLLVQDSMEVLADNQRVQFENYISNKIELLRGLVTFPEIYEMDTAKQCQFIKGHSQDLGFHHLFIMQKDGMAYYVEESLCRNQKDEPFYNHVMENSTYITEPFYGADATTMTISVSIYDNQRKKIGALCGAIELNEVQEMFRQNRMFLNGKSYLVNRNGYYIATDDMKKVYNKVTVYGESYSDVTLIKNAFETKSDKKGTIVQEGVEYLANVTYLKDFDWAIVQCIEKTKILEDLAYIDMWRYSSFVIVAFIIICVTRIVLHWHRSDKKNNTDTLTGCGSRSAMQNLLNRLELEKQSTISIVYLDLNKFKQVNDTYGHEVGDIVLCMFSDTLVEVFGSVGYVGRMGGDEFMAILLNQSDDEITILCQKVQQRLAEKSKELSFDYTISTSYGFATREKGSDICLDEIVTKADERMYCNKGSIDKA